MKRIALLIGSLAMLSAGTASAQSSVSLSLGFGAPRPYFEGSVFVGRPYLRPLYRPYYYDRFHLYRRYYIDPRIIVVEPRGYHRFRGHKRGWDRDRDHRFSREFEQDRRRFDRDRFDRDDDE